MGLSRWGDLCRLRAAPRWRSPRQLEDPTAAVGDGQSWWFPTRGERSSQHAKPERCVAHAPRAMQGERSRLGLLGDVALARHSLRCLQQPQEGAWGPGEARDHSCGMQGRILAGEVVATATGRLCGMILFTS